MTYRIAATAVALLAHSAAASYSRAHCGAALLVIQHGRTVLEDYVDSGG